MLTACSGAPPVASPTQGSTTPTATTGSATDPLAGCPAALDLASLPVVARLRGDDDDLAVGTGGSIWVSEPAAGHLVELSPTGAVVHDYLDPDGPEGMVFTADGRLLLAEQRTNHIDEVDPATGARALFATVPGATGLDVGIDGIGLDQDRARLLVPDSPTGTLLSLTLSGGFEEELARGLGRPVAATPARGTVLVGVENAPGLVRIGTDGRTTAVTSSGVLRSVDEVVARGALVYVADLGAGTVDAVDPVTGRVRPLVTGTPAPQGLALDGGRLLVTDSTRQEIAETRAC